MIIFYLAAGVNHFRMPGFYLPLVPDYIPNKSLVNILSGLAEILLAVLLAFAKTRKRAAAGIFLLLIAFIPSHIWFIHKDGCVDPEGLCVPEWVAWVRLFIVHPVLMAWALFHYKEER